MAATDKQMRDGIATVIRAAAPTAVVFPWWVLGHNRDEWAAVLRSANDQDRAHGWVITRRANEQIAGAGGHNTERRTYYLLGFHYYETGNETSNSDDLFGAEIDAVGAAFANKSALPSAIRLHEQFQAVQIDLLPAGADLLHFVQGILVVKTC